MAGSKDLLSLLRRAIELAMPDLRHFYRVVRKARVERTYASDGRYWADVQPLRNDESVDEAEPVIPRVEIPILWAGPQRGVVCPPLQGAYCDLEYYDGDPNYPRISNFRWHASQAPACEVGAFIIQAEPGTYIKIDAAKKVLTITPSDVVTQAGGDSTTEIGGDSTAEVGGDKTETIGGTWTISAPLIIQQGNVQSSGPGGAVGSVATKAHTSQEGSYTLVGPLKCSTLEITGDVVIGGNLTTAGNSDAATRTGGPI